MTSPLVDVRVMRCRWKGCTEPGTLEVFDGAWTSKGPWCPFHADIVADQWRNDR